MKQIEPLEFLRDVADHVLTAPLDSGIYRHLRFRQPKNSNHWFEVITWPGCLTIHGDMGTWTFSRVDDMFTFFRGTELRINASYWAEKLCLGTHGGTDEAKVFNEEAFRAQIVAQLSEYYGFEDERLVEITEAVTDDILRQEGEWDLKIAARDFSYKFADGDKFHFDSCELPSGKDYGYHFLWCLYAIVWGIQRYDEVKASADVSMACNA